MLTSIGLSASQHQPSLHTRPGFVTANRASTHFHAANDLLNALYSNNYRLAPLGPVLAYRKPALYINYNVRIGDDPELFWPASTLDQVFGLDTNAIFSFAPSWSRIQMIRTGFVSFLATFIFCFWQSILSYQMSETESFLVRSLRKATIALLQNDAHETLTRLRSCAFIKWICSLT